jgi:hypothetical protein
VYVYVCVCACVCLLFDLAATFLNFFSACRYVCKDVCMHMYVYNTHVHMGIRVCRCMRAYIHEYTSDLRGETYTHESWLYVCIHIAYTHTHTYIYKHTHFVGILIPSCPAKKLPACPTRSKGISIFPRKARA